MTLPIIQAPMAGTSTSQLAAAVTNAGGLGSIAVDNAQAANARTMITAVQRGTSGSFNVNLSEERRMGPRSRRNSRALALGHRNASAKSIEASWTTRTCWRRRRLRPVLLSHLCFL
jgi:NAD(P)H-dependent flavin oxidoreductase YrpB (nitropropane dioxygenase family)